MLDFKENELSVFISSRYQVCCGGGGNMSAGGRKIARSKVVAQFDTFPFQRRHPERLQSRRIRRAQR